MGQLGEELSEAGIGLPLLRKLIRAQFPAWGDLPVSEVRSAGTDNAVYRLGDGMAVRLPRHAGAAVALAREQRWLPRLAPQLPLTVPVPLALGVPGEGLPFPWLVSSWIAGHNAAGAPGTDLASAAVRLGQFVAALHRIDPARGPASVRGGHVSTLDRRVHGEIRDLGADGTVDPQLATAAWHTAVAAPAWDRAPVWVHADLYPPNLLSRHGRLAAVIDFGLLGTGDPAIDLLPAWAWFTAAARDLFRAETAADEATWARGRGWALGLGLGAAHFYRRTNPALAAIGRYSVSEALTDYQHHG